MSFERMLDKEHRPTEKEIADYLGGDACFNKGCPDGVLSRHIQVFLQLGFAEAPVSLQCRFNPLLHIFCDLDQNRCPA